MVSSRENELFDIDLRDVLSAIFIGREQQLDWFDIYLRRWQQEMKEASDTQVTAAPSPYNKLQGLVVLIYGHGGFGKSTLLQNYHEKTNASKFAVSDIIDWEFAAEGKSSFFHPAPGQAISAQVYFQVLCRVIAEKVGKKPEDFKEYHRAVKDVESTAKQARVVLDSLKNDERYSVLRLLAGQGAVELLRWVAPQVGHFLDQQKVTDKVKEVIGQGAQIGAEQLVHAYVKLREKLGKRLEDYLEPEVRLGLSLGYDLAYFARNFPLLIFFDTYEVIDEGDSLLRLVMAASGPRVGWVLAGRGNLWAGLEQRRRRQEKEYGYKEIVSAGCGLAIDLNAAGVGAFTVSDVVNYFELLRQHVASFVDLPRVSEQDADHILDVTLGVPLAVRIAAGLYLATTNLKQVIEKSDKQREIVDIMVERYLIHVHDEQDERKRLYGLAMLRRADSPDAIAIALDLPPEKKEVYYDSELARLQRRYSFIFTEKDQPSLHQEVRHFLRLQLLRRRNEPAIVSVNTQLKQAIEQLLTTLEELRQYKTLRARLEDEEWVEIYLDLIEQYYWFDPVQGVNYSLPFMFAAAIFKRDISVEVAAIGVFFVEQIKQPYRFRWQCAIQSLVYSTSRNPSNEEFEGLKELVQLTQQHCPAFPKPIPAYESELEAALWWRLGEAYLGKDDKTALEWYEKALTRLGQEMELKEASASAYYEVAYGIRDQKKYTECISLLNRAIELRPDFGSAYVNRSNAYSNLGQHEKVIEDCNRAIELNSTEATAYMNRGIAYSRLKKYQEAIRDQDQAIALDPSDADYYNNRGVAYDEQQQYEQAIGGYTQAIALDPSDAKYYYNRGNTYVNQQQYEQAIGDYTQAIALNPSDASYYNNRGIAYVNQQKYEQAIEDYNQAIALDPSNARYYNNRSNAYVNQQQYDQAIGDYTQAIALDPSDARSYYNRGVAYDEQQQYEQAIDDYTQAIALDPSDARYYYNRGTAYVNQQQYEQAIDDNTQAIALDPSDAKYYYNRGIAYYNQQKYDQAIDDYTQAIALDPSGARYYNNRGFAYYNQQQYDQAIGDYTQAIALDPSDARCYNNRGVAYDEQQQYDQAIGDYTQAIALDPSDASYYYNRGVAYGNQQQYDQAIGDYTQAIALDPSDARSYYNRGVAYDEQQQYDQAIGDYTQAIALDPSDARYYNNRGFTYYNQQKYDQAIGDYTQAIALDPSNAHCYYSRGLCYYFLKKYQQVIENTDQAIRLNDASTEFYTLRGGAYLFLGNAQRACLDFQRIRELDPQDLNGAWMAEWSAFQKTSPQREEMAQRLSTLAAISPQHYIAYMCQGIAIGMQGNLKEGLRVLEQAITQNPGEYDAYFWKGMLLAYYYQGQTHAEKAKALVEQALTLGMPPVQLTPLYWLEIDKPDFFVKCAEPLLERYEI